VYVGGGIVTKLLPLAARSDFMRGFTAKGRYTELMREIPVWIILDAAAGLIGAVQAARALVPH
jgi:glucokinase